MATSAWTRYKLQRKLSSFIFMVTGAWLLLVGVGMQEAADSRAAS
jgi:hypothetical protein